MALPIILVDSASGSDTAASGAGPTVALSGTTNASTDATGLIVTLPSGTVLTGVSTTGSDVIYLADSTAGARNFGKITATSGSGGSTPTVTVSNAFGASLSSKSWAIGGKRASVGGTASYKLLTNNAGVGDAMPGWAIEMQSAHAESVAGLVFSRAGDTTSGAIVLRGVSGAATKPVVTVTGSGYGIDMGQAYTQCRDFILKNTGSGTYGIVTTNGGKSVIAGMKVWGTTNWVNDGLYLAYDNCLAQGNEVANVGRFGINYPADMPGQRALGNYIHGCGSHGINVVNGGGLIYENIIAGNSGDGINVSVDSTGYRVAWVVGNTIHGNAGDGIEYTGSGETSSSASPLNNLITSNGGYGINFSHATATATWLLARASVVLNNAFASNTSGTVNRSAVDAGSVTATLDNGSFGTGGSFTPGPGSNLQAAYPTSIPGTV